MPNESGRELSIQALAEVMGKTPQALFQQLASMGLIVNSKNGWELTAAGKAKGGVTKGDIYTKYPAFPESLKTELLFAVPKVADKSSSSPNSQPETAHKTITATAIGKHFEKPADRINSMLSELGWIKKGELKGWLTTEFGNSLGAVQSQDKQSGVPYVRWPESILNNRILINSINEAKGDVAPVEQSKASNVDKENVEFRDKFEAKLRATDGHYVRSKAELLIDNWLYVSKVVHAYERKLPVEEDVYCDFYIPAGKNVYIEYWGLEEDSKYVKRKEIKLEIYKKHGFHLIQLADKDVNNLDDTMPRHLLLCGIETE